MVDGLTHSLAKRFHDLDASRRRSVHLRLCEFALKKWQQYCCHSETFRYVESVSGVQQTVDKGLPAIAFGVMTSGGDALEIDRRYDEPIAALHDEDLVFPEPITFAYYAIYNGFRKVALGEDVDDWLIVNQSLASVEDPSVWASTLDAAIEKGTPTD